MEHQHAHVIHSAGGVSGHGQHVDGVAALPVALDDERLPTRPGLQTGHMRRPRAASDERGAMTRLVQALLALNLYAEIDLAGRWVKLQGEQCAVYVVVAAWGNGYVTWCEDGQARGAERYLDPMEAIQVGLRCAARPDPERNDTGSGGVLP